MGTHLIEFSWNVVLKTPHKIVVSRVGGLFSDTLEVKLDGNTIMSRVAGGFLTQVGKQQFWVDDNQLELRWKYNFSNGDPESIILIAGNNVIAQYGEGTAADPQMIFQVAENNLIPLQAPNRSNNMAFVPSRSVSPSPSQPLMAENVVIHFQPEVETVEAASEQIHIPPAVTVTVRRSRTIEHTIDVKWTITSERNLELGIKPVVSASIRREIENVRGSTFKESETREDSVELSGGRKGRKYKLIWVDLWHKGVAEVSQGGMTWMLPFRFLEETKLEVIPLESRQT
jgi:hypothetical protein